MIPFRPSTDASSRPAGFAAIRPVPHAPSCRPPPDALQARIALRPDASHLSGRSRRNLRRGYPGSEQRAGCPSSVHSSSLVPAGLSSLLRSIRRLGTELRLPRPLLHHGRADGFVRFRRRPSPALCEGRLVRRRARYPPARFSGSFSPPALPASLRGVAEEASVSSPARAGSTDPSNRKPVPLPRRSSSGSGAARFRRLASPGSICRTASGPRPERGRTARHPSVGTPGSGAHRREHPPSTPAASSPRPSARHGPAGKDAPHRPHLPRPERSLSDSPRPPSPGCLPRPPSRRRSGPSCSGDCFQLRSGPAGVRGRTDPEGGCCRYRRSGTPG